MGGIARSSDETTNSGIDEGIALVAAARRFRRLEAGRGLAGPQPGPRRRVGRVPGRAAWLCGAAGPLPIAPENRSGSLVGGLVLREEIGRGAMGVVYRAFDAGPEAGGRGEAGADRA